MRIGEIELVNAGLCHDAALFENNELETVELIDYFNYLIIYNLVWRMGALYVRTARWLIENGHCVFPCQGRC